MTEVFFPYIDDTDTTRLNRLEAVYAAMTERARGFVSREAVVEVLAAVDKDAVLQQACTEAMEASRDPARREGWGIASVKHYGYGVSVEVRRMDGGLLPDLQVDIEPQAPSKTVAKLAAQLDGALKDFHAAAQRSTMPAPELAGWQERQQTIDGWTSWYDVGMRKAIGRNGVALSEVVAGIEYQWRPVYALPDELAVQLMTSQRTGIPPERVGDFVKDGQPIRSLDEIVAMLAPGRSPAPEELIASTRARTEDVARMEFLAEHWDRLHMGTFFERLLGATDFSRVSGALDKLRTSIDILREQIGTGAPE